MLASVFAKSMARSPPPRVFRGGKTARAPQGAARLYAARLQGEGMLPPPARVFAQGNPDVAGCL